jgi:molybdate-binding protein/DNA-binding transcriptional regulator YhcF (GntR family)
VAIWYTSETRGELFSDAPVANRFSPKVCKTNVIHIDPTSELPVYQQIADQVTLAVAGGRLRAGDRLEPVRDMATRLGVNASTVARAYLLLEHTGVIQTNRRRGSVIASTRADPVVRALHETRLRGIMERALIEALALGYRPEEAEAAFGLQLASWRQRRLAPAPTPIRAGVPEGVVCFAGSDDLALEALWMRVRSVHPGLELNVSYLGSLEGVMAFWRGEVNLAGAHLLDEETGEYNLPILRRLFPSQSLCVITLAERQQGLLVPPGNPRKLEAWRDLAQPGLRLANRQPGSGTRALLDFHLRGEGISPKAIAGYSAVLPTHLAVAAAVAEGRADVGLGLLAASRASGLGFVPLARERYDLVLRVEDRARAPLHGLLEMARSAEFRAVVDEIGGYDTGCLGQELLL